MWNKPWTMKEGFLIGGGLIFAGLALELSVGPVVWEAFAWPANGIVLAGFLALIAVIFPLRKKIYAFQFLGTYQAAIPAMGYAVVLTIIMGLTRQKVDGTWLNNMLSFWPFVLIYVYIDLILGLVILRQIRTAAANFSLFTLHFSLLSHLGLFLALTTATLGNADMQRVKMITAIGEPEWRALTQEGAVKEMPIAIELKKFVMETYDDGSPKRFASEIQILTKTGKKRLEAIRETFADDESIHRYPVCIAKTQFSFTADSTRYGSPEGFTIRIRDLILNCGSEMIVAIAGDMLRMPGLPRSPQAERITVVNGQIEGLS